MSRRERKDEKENREDGGGGGGWASTFWKVARAAAIAVVAGGLYSVLKQLEAEQVAVGAGGSGGPPLPPDWASTFWKVTSAAAATAVVAGGVYSVLKQPEAEQVAVEAKGSGGVKPEAWTKPKVGWLKLNVDGSHLQKIPSSGCGGALRDDFGNWVKGFAKKLDSNLRKDETEKEGILQGMKWAKEKLGVRKVEVESDSEGVVKKVTNWSKKANDHYIREIRELLSSPDWEATLTSIDRRANKVADKLAAIASKRSTSFDLKEYDSPPSSPCRTAFNDDLRLL